MFCLPLRECQRQRDKISFAPAVCSQRAYREAQRLQRVCMHMHKQTGTHKHTHTTPALPPLTPSSFIKAWIDQRVKERAPQSHIPYPERSSHSGPGGSKLVPVCRLRGGSHTIVHCLTELLLGVYHPHSPLISSVFQRVCLSHYKRRTHAHTSFHVTGIHRPDVILHSQAGPLVFHS